MMLIKILICHREFLLVLARALNYIFKFQVHFTLFRLKLRRFGISYSVSMRFRSIISLASLISFPIHRMVIRYGVAPKQKDSQVSSVNSWPRTYKWSLGKKLNQNNKTHQMIRTWNEDTVILIQQKTYK